MWILVRALTYASGFIGFLLVFLPARLLSATGLTGIPDTGPWQVLGMVIAAAGAILAVSCILTFVFVGKGTPAPFDPPRRLVIAGPYAIVRNPMYLGAILALLGAALFYQALALAGYAAVFWLITHLFVVSYEEPTLRQTFGEAYDAYCKRVGRWTPLR